MLHIQTHTYDGALTEVRWFGITLEHFYDKTLKSRIENRNV